MHSRAAVALLSAAPVPLRIARLWLHRDNRLETAKNSWERLRHVREAPRYAAVRAAVERYAPDGLVLDVGCSQGILQEGLRYGAYVGVDPDAAAIARAARKTDGRTTFVVADGATYVPPRAPDAVVLNEVVYYFADPVAVAERYAALTAPDGVLVISIFARAWASRRLLARLASEFPLLEQTTATSGHLAWTVAVYGASRTSDQPPPVSP